jgi:hypothetical protein
MTGLPRNLFPMLPIKPALLLLITTLFFSTILALQPTSPSHLRSDTPHLHTILNEFPLSFIPNVGQTASSIHYQLHAAGGNVFFTPTEVIFTLFAPPARQEQTDISAIPKVSILDRASKQAEFSNVRQQFVGAQAIPRITGSFEQAGKVNYLLGSDPSHWFTNLPTYGEIVYQQLYPGIALHYDGADGQLKGTYTVAPGADPSQIRWRYDGIERVQVNKETGDLIVTSSEGGVLVEQRPVAWQMVDEQQMSVEVEYAVGSDGSVGFTLGAYNPSIPLVIDPTLIWSTYAGGSSYDRALNIATDSSGNVYITGETSSNNFTPIKNAVKDKFGGENDAFVMKINSAGNQILYSTYLGGSGYEWASGLTVDSSGSAYITGLTTSTNFPLEKPLQPSKPGGPQDAFVTKLSSDGSTLIFSTYLGGNAGQGSDGGTGTAIDAAGNVYVTGITNSTNFPLKNPLQPKYGGNPFDVFVSKISSDGQELLFSTYLGGSGDDQSYEGIALDNSNNIHITGFTNSNNFFGIDTQQNKYGGGSYDVFVSKINADGSSLLFSRYIGGSNTDQGSSIAVDDSSGSIYVVGNTSSDTLPAAHPSRKNEGGGDVFIARLDNQGNNVLYSTFFGGSAYDVGRDVVVTNSGEVYIVGATSSDKFPLVKSLQNYGGGSDAFLIKLNPETNEILYSTFFGGNGNDSGRGVSLSDSGSVYIAGSTSSSENFPLAYALEGTYKGGDSDVFVAKISDEDQPIFSIAEIQAVQVVEGVDLVQDKPTAIRVSVIGNKPQETINVSVSLRYNNGTSNKEEFWLDTPSNWDGDFRLKSSTSQLTFLATEYVTQTLYFVADDLKPTVTGQYPVEVTLSWTSGQTSLQKSFNVVKGWTNERQILFYPIAQSGLNVNQLDTNISKSIEFINAVYPTMPGKIQRSPVRPSPATYMPETRNRITLLDYLIHLWFVKVFTNPRSERIVAVVPPGVSRDFSCYGFNLGCEDWLGAANPNLPSAVIVDNVLDASPFVQEVAHELGHTWGHSKHDDTEDSPGDPARVYRGFRVDTRQVMNNGDTLSSGKTHVVRNFMCCVPKTSGNILYDGWLTPITYNKFLASKSAQVNLQQENIGNGNSIIVSGIISNNNAISLTPWYRLNTPPIDFPEGIGDYSVEIHDSAGNILYKESFPIEFTFGGSPVSADAAPFAFSIPDYDNAAVISILHNQTTLVQRTISKHKPAITLTAPQNSETLSNNYVVRWMATDADNDKLTYSMLISRDGKSTWEPLTINTDGTEVTLQQMLPGSNQYYIKIITTDGINTEILEAGPYSVSMKQYISLIVR